MREIKFRVWDELDRYMAYPGDCVEIDPKAETELCCCDMETVAVGLDGQLYLIDECGRYAYPESLGKKLVMLQFVGLPDKNQREIYEGDIFQIGKSVGVIVYSGDCFHIEWKSNPEDYNSILSIHSSRGLVIGNIYQTPELLK